MIIYSSSVADFNMNRMNVTLVVLALVSLTPTLISARSVRHHKSAKTDCYYDSKDYQRIVMRICGHSMKKREIRTDSPGMRTTEPL